MIAVFILRFHRSTTTTPGATTLFSTVGRTLKGTLPMRGAIEYGFLAPPTVLIEFCLFGAAITFVWRRTGIVVALSGSLCLFVVATPAFSSWLLVCLETKIPKDIDLSAAQAIVILGSDLRANDTATPESLGPQTLERLFFAVDAYKQLRLPIAVSGGPISNSGTPIAEMMRSALESYFEIPVTWTESKSRTTFENAAFTARLLQNMNIHTVIVVTQARDEPRAIWSFERAGLVALPWTSPRAKLKTRRISDFLPNITSLEESHYTLHELIGAIYYRLRY